MTRLHLLLFFCLFSGICSAHPSQKTQQLDSLFSMLHAQYQFNGTVLVAEKGKIVFEKGYGYRNEDTRQPNNASTIFELASCSKQFTATAIVLLKRQGKLRYEDKITLYLPELKSWDKVTIYDLLRHTSGIPEYLGDMAGEWDKTKIATNDDLIRYYAARQDTLEFERGSRHRYNNTNYALLAGIIERLSGQTYGDFLADHVFKPLNMKHTFVYNRRQHPQNIPNYATGYVWAKNSFNKVTSEHPRYGDSVVYSLDGIVGAAKVNSNVEDLYRWIMALRSHRLLTPAEFEEMTALTTTTNGRTVPYGFGLDLSKGDNKFSFGHTGSWDGYASLIHHNLLKDRTVIILQNFKMGVFPYNNIAQILEGQPLREEYRRKVALPEEDMRKYTGVYVDSQDKEEAHVITCLNGHLVYNTTKATWDLRFFPIAKNEFLGIRQGSNDSILRFITLDNGDVRMEMLQEGNVIGSSMRKNKSQ